MDRKDLDLALGRMTKQLDADGARYSAVLYGSAVRGDWVAGRSDVNLMLVVEDPSPAGMRLLTPAVVAWHKAGFTPPLIIGREEWARAADVFPIEITDMRSAYTLVAGVDPLKDLAVRLQDLRRALETELRGKLMRLRQAYVRFGDVPVTLGGFAIATISQMMVLLRATAVLLGEEPETVIHDLPRHFGPDAQAVQEVLAHRRDGEWACPPETFVRYLEAVRFTVNVVDHHQLGDS